jgi:serine/threonine protein kinase
MSKDTSKKDITFPHIRSESAMEELADTYALGQVLGQGAFGIVNLAEHKTSKLLYACKTIKKKIGSTSAYEQLEREVNIMKTLKHPNVISLSVVYECPRNIALIMELCDGGEIVQVIRQQGYCADDTVRSIITQLVDAVSK